MPRQRKSSFTLLHVFAARSYLIRVLALIMMIFIASTSCAYVPRGYAPIKRMKYGYGIQLGCSDINRDEGPYVLGLIGSAPAYKEGVWVSDILLEIEGHDAETLLCPAIAALFSVATSNVTLKFKERPYLKKGKVRVYTVTLKPTIFDSRHYSRNRDELFEELEYIYNL